MDAISFVLGIKSSHLRSAHLRELIYRGRVLQNSAIGDDGGAVPQGNGRENGVDGEDGDDDDEMNSQAQRGDPKSAWVMAVYEDDKGDEQRWKRTITRSGTSEYRINERVVTAQQYNEALEHEHILIKARNFLVFQGDVEAIAQQSPKDLTRLVEQISGSLEYKAEYEKLEAEQETALENQTYHLNRRRGINSEVKQYQDQKRDAEAHANKADERDQAIVTHVLWKLYQFQRVIEESQADIEKYQEEMQEHRRSVGKYDKKMADAQKEAGKATRETERIQREIKKQEKEIELKENEIEPFRVKIESSGKRHAKVAARVAEIQKEIDGHQSTLASCKKDLATVEKARSQWEKERAKAEKSKGRELTDADHQEYGKLRARVNVGTAAEQSRLDAASRLMKTNEETVKSLRSKMESIQWKTSQLDMAMSDIEVNIKQNQETREEVLSEINSKKVELAALRSETSKINNTRRELDEKMQVILGKLVDADGARRESRKEEKLREILTKLRRYFPGVKGRVFDLCKPKMQKYGEAVSTVLGRNLDAVVVDTEKTARDCIQYLHEEQLGLLTFIPLDTIQTKTTTSTLRGMHRGMRMAIDAIDFEASLERAMIYSMGNAVICDDLSIAKWVCYDKAMEVKAVTLDGTVIHKGGNMTGGHGPSDRGGRRWEDSEVANLMRIRDDLMEQVRSLPKLDDRSKEENLGNELRQLERRLERIDNEIKALQRNLESKEKEYQNADGQLQEVQPKFEEAGKDLEQLKSNFDREQRVVDDVEDKIFAGFCQRLHYENIRAYEAQQGDLQQEASKKKLEFTTQISKLENQIAFEEKRLADTTTRLNKVQSEIEKNNNSITELGAQKAALEDASDTMAANLELLQERLAKQKKVKDDRNLKVNEAREEQRKRQSAMHNDQKAIADLDAQIQRTASERYTVLRRCKLEDIVLPLTDDSASLEDLPIDEVLGQDATAPDPDAMQLDNPDPDETRLGSSAVQDYNIGIDFEDLDDDLRASAGPSADAALEERIRALAAELEKLSPNTRAMGRLDTATSRLRTTEKDFEAARRSAQRAKKDFADVSRRRTELFVAAFTHISDGIDGIYKDLTRSANFPLGGQAYLDLLDADAPFAPGSTGIKYHVTPPLKRFRELSSLSGGEKTIAALALLFAVHSFHPSPFFVLDEVDAALDNANVQRVRGYLEKHSGPGMQCIVISLKTGLFEGSEGLVGVWRDQGEGTSRVLTLDLRRYQPVEVGVGA